MPHALIIYYQKRALELQWGAYAYRRIRIRLAQLQAEEADRVEVEYPLALANMPSGHLVWIRDLRHPSIYFYDSTHQHFRFVACRTYSSGGYRWRIDSCFSIDGFHYELNSPDCPTLAEAELHTFRHMLKIHCGILDCDEIDNLTREAPK